jgi:DNA-binding protein HU-beta
MNQSDPADAVAGTRKAEAAKAVEAMPGTIRDGLERGERITVRGLGNFEAAHQEARQGRDPRTGQAVQVAASTTVEFTPAEGLKDARYAAVVRKVAAAT